MSRSRFPVAAAVLALLFSSGLCAQSSTALDPGARLRITQANGRPVVGVLAALTYDGLTPRSDSAPNRFSPDALARMARSDGRDVGWKTFLYIMGGCTVAGGLIGAITYSPCEDDGFMACFLAPESRGEALVMGAAVGALLGIPLGVLITAALRHDRGREASLDAARRPAGLALTMTLRR